MVLEAIENVTIYQLFEGYTVEQINNAIASLSTQEKYNLKARYGEDYSKPYIEQLRMSASLRAIIHKIRLKLFSKEGNDKSKLNVQNNELDNKTIQIYNNSTFHNMLSMMNRMEAVILELRFGFYDKVYTTEQIAKLFNKSELEIIAITKTALEKVKTLSSQFSSEIISVMENDTNYKLSLSKQD